MNHFAPLSSPALTMPGMSWQPYPTGRNSNFAAPPAEASSFPSAERRGPRAPEPDLIEAMLQQGSDYGSPLQVAMRRETQKVLQEQDLRLAGLVDGESAAQAGRLLAVQGLIASRITITMDVQRSTRSTVDWMSILGEFAGSTREPARVRPERQTVPRSVRVYRAPRYTRDSREAYVHDPRIHPSSPYYPYGQPPYRDPRHPQPVPPPAPVTPPRSGGRGQFTLRTREVEEISRHLTVTCSFSLIDAVTGQALMQYSPPPYRKTDKVSPNFLFGGLIDEADLDPVDHFIGELVERATQEFASMLVPARVEVSYELVGRQTRSEEGIRALRADDYEGAMRSFQEELAKRPDSDEVVFAMGVTSELMGDPEQALAYYRQALGMRRVDEDRLPIYEAARNRLVAHIGRYCNRSRERFGEPTMGGKHRSNHHPPRSIPSLSRVGPRSSLVGTPRANPCDGSCQPRVTDGRMAPAVRHRAVATPSG